MKYSVEICLRELLFVQECVIIPGFGGFLTKYKSAEIDFLNYTITPPTKSISFNRQLRVDDGLLANTVSMMNGISFSEANIVVKKWTAQFEANLRATNSCVLHQIGTFEWDALGGIISFQPDLNENYLIESYGFPVIVAKPVFRHVPLQEDIVTKEEKLAVQLPNLVQDSVEEPIIAEPFLKTNVDISSAPIQTRNVMLFCMGLFSLAVMSLPFIGVHTDKMNLNEGNILSVFTTVFPSQSVEVAPLILDNILTPELSVYNEVKIVAPVFVTKNTENVSTTDNTQKQQVQPEENPAMNEVIAPTQIENSTNNKYVVIMGAFKERKNADTFSAKIAADNQGLTAVVIVKGTVAYVAIPAGNTSSTAAEKLKLAQTVNPDCWIKKM